MVTPASITDDMITAVMDMLGASSRIDAVVAYIAGKDALDSDASPYAVLDVIKDAIDSADNPSERDELRADVDATLRIAARRRAARFAEQSELAIRLRQSLGLQA